MGRSVERSRPLARDHPHPGWREPFPPRGASETLVAIPDVAVAAGRIIHRRYHRPGCHYRRPFAGPGGRGVQLPANDVRRRQYLYPRFAITSPRLTCRTAHRVRPQESFASRTGPRARAGQTRAGDACRSGISPPLTGGTPAGIIPFGGAGRGECVRISILDLWRMVRAIGEHPEAGREEA